jgi:hypothetical protein
MMRQLTFSMALGLATGVASLASAVELLTNGNLDRTEATVIVDNAPPGPGPEDFFLPKPQNWQNIGTRTIGGPYEDEMSSEPWAGPAPTPVTTDGAANPPHPEGCGGDDCAVFFKPFSGNVANGPATGHLIQDVPGVPGQGYTLTGWAGAEANAMMGGAEIALEFLNGGGGVIGGTVVNLLPTLFVDNGEAFDYKKYTAAGVAPAGTAFVRARASMIDAVSNPAGGGQAFVVDDFSLTDGIIPEPATAALVLLGLMGMMGFVRRR